MSHLKIQENKAKQITKLGGDITGIPNKVTSSSKSVPLTIMLKYGY